jgi:hypothetical protein
MASTIHRSRAVLLLTSLLLVAACGSSPTAVPSQVPSSPSPSGPTGEVPSAEPDAPSADPSPVVTPGPSVAPTPAPTPKPIPVPTVWSKATTVLKGPCWNPATTVDGAGHFHVAAVCGNRIRYATSSDGRAWTRKTFSAPLHHEDVGAQLAVDGSTLYVAFTRLRIMDGACGDDGLVDVGVYYRTRHLPSGAWSAPVRIGHLGDHMAAFRVVGGIIHETFTSDDGKGPVAYGRSDHGRFLSVALPKAVDTSLRVGDDGRARIAYTTGSDVRYATITTDGRLSASTIYRSSVMQLSAPSLVLGQGDRPYIAWSAHEQWGGGGCADGSDAVPQPGTYFATLVDGAWSIRRISRIVDAPSILVDPQTGRVEVVVSYDKGIRHLTRRPDGSWTGRLIPGTFGLGQSLVRRDPRSGHLVLVASTWNDDVSNIVALVMR